VIRCCSRCESGGALARVGEAYLCEACLVARLKGPGIAYAGFAARFMHALIQPGTIALRDEMPKTDAQIRCRLCGLTFAEFESKGRAGCGECYIVFRPSVTYALSVLHRSGTAV